MNSTELQALRRLLFFTQAEAAAMIGGVSERAWKHWEAGARLVPTDVDESIRELAEWRESAIDAVLDSITSGEESIKQRGGSELDIDAMDIALVWYENATDWIGEPNQWKPHQSACAALVGFDERVRLVLFNGPTYAAWLKGRKDSQVMRALWAGETIRAA